MILFLSQVRICTGKGGVKLDLFSYIITWFHYFSHYFGNSIPNIIASKCVHEAKLALNCLCFKGVDRDTLVKGNIHGDFIRKKPRATPTRNSPMAFSTSKLIILQSFGFFWSSFWSAVEISFHEIMLPVLGLLTCLFEFEKLWFAHGHIFSIPFF